MLNSVPLPRDVFQQQVLRNSSVTLQKIRDQLMGNELLLEYVLSEPSSYCFAIAKDGARVILLAGRARIEAQVESYPEDIKAK